MIGNKHPPYAQAQPAPPNPKRDWDDKNQCWVEAMTICRKTNGTFGRKSGTEPDSRLFPNWEEKGAA
jgi:hypothetical protein